MVLPNDFGMKRGRRCDADGLPRDSTRPVVRRRRNVTAIGDVLRRAQWRAISNRVVNEIGRETRPGQFVPLPLVIRGWVANEAGARPYSRLDAETAQASLARKACFLDQRPIWPCLGGRG